MGCTSRYARTTRQEGITILPGPRYLYYSADYPGIPQNLQGSSSDGNAVLTWDASANGGVSLISYHIYRSTSSNTETEIATVSGTTLTYTDTSVAGGQDYYYKVAADNGYIGTLSSEVLVTMPPGKPGTVRDLQAVPGDGMMNLTWSAPLGDGGSAITNYKIYRSTESGAEALIDTTADATRSFQDGSLVLGETYYYQVTAINSIGESAKCTEVMITFIQVPTAPRDLQAEVGSGQIELTWLAPLDNGGNPISYYGINRLNVTGGGDWSLWYSYTEGQTFFNDTDVQLGCTYRYSVIAYNDYYEGPESNIVTVTYALLPSEPYNINLAPGAGTMLVTWNAPNTTGGSALVSYWVYWGTSPGARTNSVSAGLSTSYTIHGLANDTVYYITVAANNSAGRGLFSGEKSAQTPTVPGAVVDLMMIAGDGQVTLGWAPPSSNGRSGITYYCVYRGTTAGSQTHFVGAAGSNCTWIDRPLVNGRTYYYSVHAHNAVGVGPNTILSISSGNHARFTDQHTCRWRASSDNRHLEPTGCPRRRHSALPDLPRIDLVGRHASEHRGQRHDLRRYRGRERDLVLLGPGPELGRGRLPVGTGHGDLVHCAECADRLRDLRQRICEPDLVALIVHR